MLSDGSSKSIVAYAIPVSTCLTFVISVKLIKDSYDTISTDNEDK